MINVDTGAPLRRTERRQLLAHLEALGAPDPDTRATAAQKAAELLLRKGLSWPVLIPSTLRSGEHHDDEPAIDWRRDILDLLSRPDIDPDDRAFLHKLAGWRAPGTDGLRRLRQIVGRASR